MKWFVISRNFCRCGTGWAVYVHNFGVVRSLNRSESEGFRIQNDCGDWNNHYQILKPSQKKSGQLWACLLRWWRFRFVLLKNHRSVLLHYTRWLILKMLWPDNIFPSFAFLKGQTYSLCSTVLETIFIWRNFAGSSWRAFFEHSSYLESSAASLRDANACGRLS